MQSLVIDLDGTIYVGNHGIEGVKGFLEFLVSSGIQALFVSNNSSKRRVETRDKIASLYNVVFPIESFYNSTLNTCDYLKSLGLRKFTGLCSESFIAEAEEEGLEYLDIYSDQAKEAQAIIVSYDKGLTFKSIENTARLVNNTTLPYIATHPDMLCPTENGYIPDIGAIIAMLNAVCNREPLVLGKPSSVMASCIAKRVKCEPGKIIVIGDRLYTDVKMAYENGFVSVLVLSGESTLSDVEACPYKPDYILGSVSDLIASSEVLRIANNEQIGTEAELSPMMAG